MAVVNCLYVAAASTAASAAAQQWWASSLLDGEAGAGGDGDGDWLEAVLRSRVTVTLLAILAAHAFLVVLLALKGDRRRTRARTGYGKRRWSQVIGLHGGRASKVGRYAAASRRSKCRAVSTARLPSCVARQASAAWCGAAGPATGEAQEDRQTCDFARDGVGLCCDYYSEWCFGSRGVWISSTFVAKSKHDY